MVLVEGFACGVPCIAYYSDGVVDIIDEKNGFLVKQRDINGLARRIIELLTSNNNKFAIKGRKKVEKFFFHIYTIQEQ